MPPTKRKTMLVLIACFVFCLHRSSGMRVLTRNELFNMIESSSASTFNEKLQSMEMELLKQYAENDPCIAEVKQKLSIIKHQFKQKWSAARNTKARFLENNAEWLKGSILLPKAVSTAFEYNCVQPELKCPNENVTFWLYTRSNPKTPHQLLAMDPDSIKSAPWVADAPIKVLIHGYTGHRDFSPNTEIRPAYLECCDYNLISVDYNPIAREPCYFEAAHNTELVGLCLAQLIDRLVQVHSYDLKRFHIIGFSLGGQTAGFAGMYTKSGKLERISALDPAMPLFVTANVNKKVDPSDAKFVDVLHTNALEKGKLEASGHVDCFANGGITQPGCKATAEQTKSGCDHARAPLYYAESVLTQVGFYATKCHSWITYMIGWCELVSSEEEILCGEYVPRNASGIYFFSTNSQPPFARGRNKNREVKTTDSNNSTYN